MISKALGLIETYGYIPAVEAADICTKTANVDLIGISLVGGGLVTVKISGEVSAVKASIEAGAAAAQEVGKIVSIDIIARLGTGLDRLIYSDEKDSNLDTCQQSIKKEENKYTKARDKETTIQERKIDYNGKILSDENIGFLDDIKVVELRKIARNIQNFPMQKIKIKYAKKDELINAIKNYLKEKED